MGDKELYDRLNRIKEIGGEASTGMWLISSNGMTTKPTALYSIGHILDLNITNANDRWQKEHDEAVAYERLAHCLEELSGMPFAEMAKACIKAAKAHDNMSDAWNAEFDRLCAEDERRKEEAEKAKAVGDPQVAILELQRQIEELKAKGN